MKFKALFLLAIFLSSHLMGIACALHFSPKLSPIDTKEKSKERVVTISEPAVVPHTHAEGTPPHHHGGKKAVTKPAKSAEPLHDEKKKPSDSAKDDGCCQDEVNEINSVVKVVPQKGADIKAPVFEVISNFQSIISFYPQTKEQKAIFFIAVKYPPPKTDIRITIQSFQI